MRSRTIACSLPFVSTVAFGESFEPDASVARRVRRSVGPLVAAWGACEPTLAPSSLGLQGRNRRSNRRSSANAAQI